MANKATKRALLSSVLALFLCFSMLLGTTYAWFTDSVTSANNKITAGTLDVRLLLWDGNDYVDISESGDPIFGAAGLAQNALNTLWEPGKTQVAYLAIQNKGTLDLQYRVNIAITDYTKNLYEVMEYAIIPDAANGTGVTGWTDGIAVVPGNNTTQAKAVALPASAIHYFALAVHMNEEAGNEYQGGEITCDINVLATQLAAESDSFGNTYDSAATFPSFGSASTAIDNVTDTYALDIYDTQVEGENNKQKIGYANVDKAAIADGAENISVTVKKQPAVNANVTVALGQEAVTYEITVSNLKAGNTTPVEVGLRLPTGLDPATVALYHYGTEIPSNYDPNTGYLTFESASFSPFTVVYDAESKYVAPEIPVDPEDPEKVQYPTAKVTYLGVNAGEAEIEWGNYGQWSPTEGLDSTLEAAFEFACPDYDAASAEEKAVIDAYRYWYCDFYVSLDKALGENQIFLGGNYGDFGWVGFHNGDITLAANEEIGLLESVTTNPWTYNDIENYVGKFICGVGDVNNALEGATFTVKLRLTNPEDEAEFYDVNVVTYKFGGSYSIDGVTHVSTGEQIQDAVNNGDSNITLDGDIDLSQGLVIPGN